MPCAVTKRFDHEGPALDLPWPCGWKKKRRAQILQGSNRVFGDTDRDTIAETGKPQPLNEGTFSEFSALIAAISGNK